MQSAFTTANANTTEDYVVTVNDTIQATAPLTLAGAKMTLAGNGTIQGYDSTASGSTKNSLIRARGSYLTLDGVTISGHKGYAAMSLSSSSFTMKSGAIKNNTSTQNGGAINSYSSAIIMTGGEISDNTSSQGGGIYIDCSTHYAVLKSPSVDFYPGAGNALEMTGGNITGNIATLGGGVAVEGDGCKINIDGGNITSNKAIEDHTVETMMGQGIGGGIVNTGSSKIHFISGNISDNTATNFGGGVALSCGAESTSSSDSSAALQSIPSTIELATPGPIAAPQATDCFTMDGGLIKNNSSKFGGGVFGVYSIANFNDGEITNNTTTTQGGGIFSGPYSTTNITDGTISDNKSRLEGDGVYLWNSSKDMFYALGAPATAEFPKMNPATLNLSSDALINKNNDVYLDGTDTAINVLSKLNKVTRENPITLTPSDTTTVSTTAGVVGNKLVNYFAKASALEADMQDYFVLSDYVSTDAHIVQSDFTGEENYLILGKRMVSLFLKFSGIVGAEDETISLTKNDVITKSPAYQAVLAKYAKKGYTLEFYTDQEYKNLLPADQSIVEDTTLYARYVKNPNTLDSVAIYTIIGTATIAGASILLKSQKRSRR